MTVRKDIMLCPTGRGLAATRRPFGDAHLPVWHSTRTRISSHYQTTQHKNKVSTLSGDLTNLSIIRLRLSTLTTVTHLRQTVLCRSNAVFFV